LELPVSQRQVKLKILTQGDQNKIDIETKGLKKLKRDAAATTLLKHVIIELDGDSDKSKIRKFIDKELLAIDSRSIRQYLRKVTPDINLSIEVPDEETGDTFRSQLNIGLDFFWPDAEI
jgi:5S rRNA maturation endonuclease (ribonuclease M5)